MKRATREWLEGIATISNRELAGVAKDALKSHAKLLNMLEHIEWYGGTVPAKSRNALRRLVGLKPIVGGGK